MFRQRTNRATLNLMRVRKRQRRPVVRWDIASRGAAVLANREWVMTPWMQSRDEVIPTIVVDRVSVWKRLCGRLTPPAQ